MAELHPSIPFAKKKSHSAGSSYLDSRIVRATWEELAYVCNTKEDAICGRHFILLNLALKLETTLKIRVEPGIFEWTKWEASKTTPAFMTLEELRDANFYVDADYRPAVPRSSLLPAESYEEYVDRCTLSMGRILAACPPEAGIILVVGHGSSLDSCTRPLLGLPPREYGDFAQLVRKIPSLGMCFCEENQEQGRWELVNPPVKTLTHGANSAFNWRNWISAH